MAVAFSDITGAPTDNAALASALAGKQASLGFTPENVANKNTPSGYAGPAFAPLAYTSNVISAYLKTGNIIDNLVSSFQNTRFTAVVSTTRFDGGAITDADVDNIIYFKFSDGLYARRVFPPGNINLYDFGASGNGTYDNTNAFIKAHAFCQIVNRKLYIPIGTFVINTSLVFNGGGIIGEDRNKSIIKIADSSAISTTSALFVVIGDSTTFSNFSIDGNRANNLATSTTGIKGIYGNNVRNLKIDSVSIRNVRNRGINILNAPNLSITNVLVDNCGKFDQEVASIVQSDRLGIDLQNQCYPGQPYYCSSDVVISNVTVTNSGCDGFCTTIGTTYVNVTGNCCGTEMKTKDPGAAGIYLRSVAYIEYAAFINCIANCNTGLGIDVGQLPADSDKIFKNILIDGCIASNNALMGIGLASVYAGTIINCKCYNNGTRDTLNSGGTNYRRAGIGIGNFASTSFFNITVKNNLCYDDNTVKKQQNGLFIQKQVGDTLASSGNVMITDNNFSGNANDWIGYFNGLQYVDYVGNNSFLSVQRNSGIVYSDSAPASGALVNPKSPIVRLNATTAISVAGLTPGVIGDMVQLYNNSSYNITLTDSSVFVLGGNTILAPGAAMSFVNFNGTSWRYLFDRSVLENQALLDFPNTAANSSSSLTVSVPGATNGDVVMLGVPNECVSGGNNSFFAWVSGPNTVTIRFDNNSAGAINPGSGMFKVKIVKG